MPPPKLSGTTPWAGILSDCKSHFLPLCCSNLMHLTCSLYQRTRVLSVFISRLQSDAGIEHSDYPGVYRPSILDGNVAGYCVAIFTLCPGGKLIKAQEVNNLLVSGSFWNSQLCIHWRLLGRGESPIIHPACKELQGCSFCASSPILEWVLQWQRRLLNYVCFCK